MAALSHLMGQVGVREAMDQIEERGGRAECQLAVWRWGGAQCGDREGCSMWLFGCSVLQCCVLRSEMVKAVEMR